MPPEKMTPRKATPKFRAERIRDGRSLRDRSVLSRHEIRISASECREAILKFPAIARTWLATLKMAVKSVLDEKLLETSDIAGAASSLPTLSPSSADDWTSLGVVPAAGFDDFRMMSSAKRSRGLRDLKCLE